MISQLHIHIIGIIVYLEMCIDVESYKNRTCCKYFKLCIFRFINTLIILTFNIKGKETNVPTRMITKYKKNKNKNTQLPLILVRS